MVKQHPMITKFGGHVSQYHNKLQCKFKTLTPLIERVMTLTPVNVQKKKKKT